MMRASWVLAWMVVGGLFALGACAGDPYDPNDPDGDGTPGVTSGAGEVACGVTVCDADMICCAEPTSSPSFRCVSPGGCDGKGNTPIKCDDSADCGGEACCMMPDGTGENEVGCRLACDQLGFQLCGSDADCPMDKPHCNEKNLFNSSYRVCESSNGG